MLYTYTYVPWYAIPSLTFGPRRPGLAGPIMSLCIHSALFLFLWSKNVCPHLLVCVQETRFLRVPTSTFTASFGPRIVKCSL